MAPVQLGTTLKLYSFFSFSNSSSFLRPQNCRSPAELDCNTPDTCRISLKTNVPLADCENKNANYIAAEYRLVPGKSF